MISVDRIDCGKFKIDVLTRTDVLTIKIERETQTEKNTSFSKKMINDVWFTFIVRRYSNHHILCSCLTYTNQKSKPLNQLKTLVEVADDQSTLMQAEIVKLAIKAEIKEEHDNDNHVLRDVTETISTMNVNCQTFIKTLQISQRREHCTILRTF